MSTQHCECRHLQHARPCMRRFDVPQLQHAAWTGSICVHFMPCFPRCSTNACCASPSPWRGVWQQPLFLCNARLTPGSSAAMKRHAARLSDGRDARVRPVHRAVLAGRAGQALAHTELQAGRGGQDVERAARARRRDRGPAVRPARGARGRVSDMARRPKEQPARLLTPGERQPLRPWGGTSASETTLALVPSVSARWTA